MAEGETAWSQTELQEKTIEPDKGLDVEHINRNLQLGNISKQEYPFFITKTNKVVELMNYPFSRGGPLYRNQANKIMKQLNLEVISSNSREALARTLLNTRVNVSKLKDETPEKGWFSGVRRREGN